MLNVIKCNNHYYYLTNYWWSNNNYYNIAWKQSILIILINSILNLAINYKLTAKINILLIKIIIVNYFHLLNIIINNAIKII